MKPIRDIKNARFGRLTAVEPTDRREHGRVIWRCRCDCGREILLPRQSLIGNDTTSCGCRGRGRAREDLTGRTFGRVTVERFAFGENWWIITACGRQRLAWRRSIIKGMKCCRKRGCKV